MHRPQARDGRKQAQRSAARRLDQRAIGMGQPGDIARFHVGYDQHARLGAVIKRARCREMLGRARQPRRAGTQFGIPPIIGQRIGPRPQRGRRHQHAMRRFQHRAGKGPHRIKPAPLDTDIKQPPFGARQVQPIDEIRIGRASKARQQLLPRAQQLRPQRQAGARAFHSRSRPAIQPIGRILQQQRQPAFQLRHRRHHRAQCRTGRRSRFHQPRQHFGDFGFKAIAVISLLGARQHLAAHGSEQAFQRAFRIVGAHPPQPAFAGEVSRRRRNTFHRLRCLIIIADRIGQPRREPAPPAAPGRAFRAEQPVLQFHRLAAGQRHRERCIGGGEQVMAFVEHQPGEAAAFRPAARRVDHHQRVIGDHQIGLSAGPCRAFDEAAAIMRAGGIDALAAPVG